MVFLSHMFDNHRIWTKSFKSIYCTSQRKHGIIERENYNISKKENQRVPNCPEEKEKAIEDALEYFGMI